jgi:hypothetical protein
MHVLALLGIFFASLWLADACAPAKHNCVQPRTMNVLLGQEIAHLATAALGAVVGSVLISPICLFFFFPDAASNKQKTRCGLAALGVSGNFALVFGSFLGLHVYL